MVTQKLLRRWREKYKGPLWFTLLAGFMLTVLFAGTLYYFFYQARHVNNHVDNSVDTNAEGGLLTASCSELEQADF